MRKTLAAIAIALLALTAFSLVASASAMPFMNWSNYQNMPANSHKMATQQSFARLDGAITEFGATNVTGTIQAQSRTVVINSTDSRQGSSATAIWTTNQSRPLNSLRLKENYTYTFYSANLVVPDTSSLNMTGYSFYLNGTWNVFQITTTFTINTDSTGNITGFNRNQNAAAIATKAYGELTVAETGSNFTLAINGVDPLTGSVHVQRITTKMFNPFKVNTDDSTATVTKADVAAVVQAYGAMPGWGAYDQRMDYNFNYKVDICDLATAAANLNV
jgi:hypothetical protein